MEKGNRDIQMLYFLCYEEEFVTTAHDTTYKNK